MQRLGTTYLPARVLSWRYQRGQRSLEEALAGPTMQASHSMAEQERNGAEEEVRSTRGENNAHSEVRMYCLSPCVDVGVGCARGG